MKKLLLALLLLFGSTALFAEKIDRYEVDVFIKRSGELAIVEKIDYDFGGIGRHGIFRDIPRQIKYKEVIKDIGLYDISVSMDGGPVAWERQTYHADHAGEILRLKIGSASRLIHGRHHFTIRYRVKMGVLSASGNEQRDAIRWNVIGTGWSIPIENVKALFFLPEVLSKEEVSLSTYTGKYGERTSRTKSRWLTPYQLEVTIDHLAPYEGATVELAFPVGMLRQSGLDNVAPTLWERFLSQWHWAALFAYLLYFFEVRKKYTGFEDKRSVAVQYLPPKGLSVLQSGLLLDKHADEKDFAAAVLELAQLGYLEINQASRHTDPVLKRLEKPQEGLTLNQKYLLNEILFKDKAFFVMKRGTPESAKRLKSKFDHINNNLYTWSVAEGYMEENPKKTRRRFLTKSLLLLLPVVAMTFYTLFRQMGMDAIFMLIFPVAFGVVGISLFFSQKAITQRIMGLVFAGAGLMPALLIPQEHGISIDALLLGPLGVLFVLLGVLYYVYRSIGKFTQKGAYAQKRLLGLQEFIKRVKEDEIRRRLALDPLYLEKLLPYAILFGQTKHWLSFFKLLAVSQPSWYNGDINNLENFGTAINNAITPPSTQSSAGGGFAGGGGFSGGGSGGGGGGSW
jgi:uncharacterized membrane protein YgcG